MTEAIFSHEKLVVYQKGLAFVGLAESLVSAWDKRHAITDHLSRASESIVMNIAEASRTHSQDARQTAIDYSIGSALECAACLDIADVKALLRGEEARRHKEVLAGIVRMLTGLRRSTESLRLREEEEPYEVRGSSSTLQTQFHHERLDVYQVGLSLMAWFCASGVADGLSAKPFKKIDQMATTMILNIAEGNGRYSLLDSRRFLKTANVSTTKIAAFLDICVHRRLLTSDGVPEAKRLLLRVANMTAAMAGLR